MRRRQFLLFAALAAALSQAPAAAPPAIAAERIALSDRDREVLADVERYLNDITTVEAGFVQNSSDGRYAEGKVWIQRPYKMRFEYDPPVPLLLIATNQTFVLYDKELQQITQVPVWDTPLWFLFDDPIVMDDALAVTRLTYGSGEIVVTIQEQQAEGNLSSVTLTFSESPVALTKWEVVDAKGVVVTTGLVNPVYGGDLDADLFDLSLLEVYEFDRQNN